MSTKKKVADFDWLAWIEYGAVKVQPVISRRGVEFWSAGFTTLSAGGWQNVMATYAVGASALEALSNLRDGIVLYKDGSRVGPHVLKREDLPAATRKLVALRKRRRGKGNLS